jgi:hypothetical protein
MTNVLFLNHLQQSCGVYQFGKRIYNLASKGSKVNYTYRELDSKQEYDRLLREVIPEFIIYNWYPATMPWLTENMVTTNKNVKHYFIFHDGHVRLDFDKYLFSGAIGKDINFPPEKVVILPRPLLEYDGAYPKNELPTIGSFGFGGWHKGFHDISRHVARSYPDAIINILMTYAYFGDVDGVETRKIAEYCHTLNTYPNIKINISHKFRSDNEVLKFLAGNDLNIFLYVSSCQGLSSVTDYALSVKRPIAIRNDPMFKHIYKDDIALEMKSVKEILENGVTPLQEYYDRWNPNNFALEMDKIYDI